MDVFTETCQKADVTIVHSQCNLCFHPKTLTVFVVESLSKQSIILRNEEYPTIT